MNPYRTANITLLGLLLFVPVFALVSPALESLVTGETLCLHKAITGEDCPFCGLTRDMRQFILTGSVDNSSNRLFRGLCTVYLFELSIRILLLIFSAGKERMLVKLDILVHLPVFIFLFLLF